MFPYKYGRLQATLGKMAVLKAKHMQTQLEGGLALYFVPKLNLITPVASGYLTW